jgi:hypothetical protein
VASTNGSGRPPYRVLPHLQPSVQGLTGILELLDVPLPSEQVGSTQL